MIEQYVLDLHEVDETQVAVVGGKGAHLGGLSRIEGIRRAGWLLRDDGRLPADHGGSAVDRRSARSAVAPEPGRPGGDPHAQRADSPDHRRDRHPGRSRGGDHPRARPARRASRLRRPIQRDGGGPADGLLRRPAGHVPERRGAGGDPPARQPVLGVAVHRAGRDLPPAATASTTVRSRWPWSCSRWSSRMRPASCSRPTPSRATGRSPPWTPASASARPWSPAW